MRFGEHRRRKFAGRERRAEGMIPKTVQQHWTFFRTTRILRQILGTNFEAVFLSIEFEAVCIVHTILYISYSLYNGNINQGSMYGTTVATKIKSVCTIILLWFSRQQVDRNFDCKISEFSQFIENCCWDNFISVFAVLSFYCRK